MVDTHGVPSSVFQPRLRRRALGAAATTAAALAAAAAVNAAVAVTLPRNSAVAALAALTPVVALGLGALVASDRFVLALGAIALPVSFHLLNAPLPGGGNVYSSDLVVALAIVSWLVARAVWKGTPAAPATPRIPFGILTLGAFAALMLTAGYRGHLLYGEKLLGQPARLVFYAGIAFALSDVSPRKAYRGLVAVNYGGTVWMILNAGYLLATGGTQTTADELSTGGTRVLSLSVSMHLATTLFLALLNLQRDQTAARRAVHLTMVGLALLGIVLGFGRSTFAAVAIVVPFIVLGFRRVRGAFFDLLPLLLPVVIGVGIVVTRVEPTIGPTLSSRLSLDVVAQNQDQSVRWREEANRVIWEQVRSSPYVGVGFGKDATFTLNGFRYETTQDPHNSFVWMLAGGGALLFGAFAMIVLRFARDAWRRHGRARDDAERILLAWPVLALVCFLLNTTAGPVFSQPTEVLFLWTLLLLPGVVRTQPAEAEAVALAHGRGHSSPRVARRRVHAAGDS